MTIVHARDTRLTETPNATMRTLASPTQGGTELLSMWKVTMTSGQQGPWHTFDHEQVWTVVDGTAAITVAGTTAPVGAGDTIVLPAGQLRRIVAGSDGFRAVVVGRSDARATTAEGDDRGVPEWIA